MKHRPHRLHSLLYNLHARYISSRYATSAPVIRLPTNSRCDARDTQPGSGNYSSHFKSECPPHPCDLNILVVKLRSISGSRLSTPTLRPMDLKFWKMRKALVAVAKKLMRAKAGLERLQVETQRNPRRIGRRTWAWNWQGACDPVKCPNGRSACDGDSRYDYPLSGVRTGGDDHRPGTANGR